MLPAESKFLERKGTDNIYHEKQQSMRKQPFLIKDKKIYNFALRWQAESLRLLGQKGSESIGKKRQYFRILICHACAKRALALYLSNIYLALKCTAAL